MTQLARPKAPAHKRMKPKRFKSEEHEAYVKSMPCLLCKRPSTWHHLRHFNGGPGMGEKAGDDMTVNLCPEDHTDGPYSVHKMGHERNFDRFHGVDLIGEANRLAASSPCKRTRELYNKRS